MNDRIKELCVQAGFVGDDMYPIFGTSQETALKNLAELIVKECAEIADNADAIREKWQSIGKFVRERFGVE
jgi:hypothetical protein